ncbi:MAG: energy-coupling factor transporter transmembrane protein EcfT, partial [Firmicutes bacterium]|nr:energy-coupling factor transporter transmembrane protein EcfT [Bacillota bacterium]
QARGADFESGNIFRRAKSLIPLLIPLFISAFRIAQELAMAMESRCYRGGDGRTKFHVMKIKGADIAALLIAAAIFAEMIVQRIMLPVIF